MSSTLMSSNPSVETSTIVGGENIGGGATISGRGNGATRGCLDGFTGDGARALFLLGCAGITAGTVPLLEASAVVL